MRLVSLVLCIIGVLTGIGIGAGCTSGSTFDVQDSEVGVDTNADGDTDGDADTDTDTDTDTDADADSDSNCDSSSISIINSSISDAIGTVGIVEWSSTISVSNATIEFGPDTNYEFAAPVDLNETNYRTLLLGMKPSSTYHYRIVVNGGCYSSDQTITTDPLPTGLPNLTITSQNEAAQTDGFIVWQSGTTAFIIDKDGDFVWWYTFTGGGGGGGGDGLSRAKMSGDRKSMWGANVNVQGGGGYMVNIGMDGLGTQTTLNVERHHDLTVLPDNSIVYIQFGSNGDDIVERSATGATRTVYSLGNDFTGSGGGIGGGNDWSHCNAIHYVPADDAYTVSCLNLNNIIKIDRASGTLLWALEGDGGGDFSGVSWDRQHGHHLLDNGNLLIFNNNGATGGAGAAASDGTDDSDTPASGGFFGGGNSMALEFAFSGSSVSQTWSYSGGESSGTFGDVERLPNGNTLVTYSNAGVMHEVDSSGNLVRTITVGGGGGGGGTGGYADWYEDLYNAPHRY
jgi:hypothetical protein